jgi:hypothetical protein
MMETRRERIRFRDAWHKIFDFGNAILTCFSDLIVLKKVSIRKLLPWSVSRIGAKPGFLVGAESRSTSTGD